MVTTIDKLTADGCSTDDKHKVCRSRGGESCAFDGAMIVLQPIADTAHIVRTHRLLRQHLGRPGDALVQG